MRVLHVIPSLDSHDGGPTVAAMHMASCGAAQGFEVSMATTLDPAEATERQISFSQPVRMDSWTCYYFPRQSRFYKFSSELYHWLRRSCARFDLVHIHAVFSFAPIAACRAAKRAGVPYVVCPHGLLNEWGMSRRRRLKNISFRLIERPLLNAAAGLHFTSQAEQREAGPLHLTARPFIVPLGIETSTFAQPPNRSVFEERYPVAKNRLLVLFLSRIDPKKGIEVLLQAWEKVIQRHPNALLVLAGSGESGYTATLQAMAERLGLGDQVLWTGFLGPEDKLIALGAADLFVLPSKSESFGIALLEAMAAGVPCVSTPGVALSEEAADVGAVQLAANEIGSVASVIADLLGSPEKRSCLAEAGRTFATSLYSLKAMGKNLADMYREIVH